MRIDAITIGLRHRRDLGDIAGLAASIAELGLLQPIVVTPDGTLIAGARRIAACQSLGWTDIAVTVVDIPAIVRGEYAENTCRKDFAPSEAVAIKREIARFMSDPVNNAPDWPIVKPEGKVRDATETVTGIGHTTVEKAERASRSWPEK